MKFTKEEKIQMLSGRLSKEMREPNLFSNTDGSRGYEKTNVVCPEKLAEFLLELMEKRCPCETCSPLDHGINPMKVKS